MTEQQYRVVADRDKGNDLRGYMGITEIGDRVVMELGRDHIYAPVRIERPVPSTDEPTPGELIARERARQIAKGYTAEHDAEHGVPKLLEWAARFAENGEYIKAAAMVEAARVLPAPSVPTREQIAEALYRSDFPEAVDPTRWDELDPGWRDDYLRNADAVLALLNEADR